MRFSLKTRSRNTGPNIECSVLTLCDSCSWQTSTPIALATHLSSIANSSKIPSRCSFCGSRAHYSINASSSQDAHTKLWDAFRAGFFHVIQWPNQKENEKKTSFATPASAMMTLCRRGAARRMPQRSSTARANIIRYYIFICAVYPRKECICARASEDNRTQPIYDMYAAYIVYAVYVCCANALRFLMWHWVIGRRPRTIYGTAIHHGRGASAVKPASARALQMEIYSKSANMRFYIQQIHIYRWCMCSLYGQSAIATAWANVCNVLDIKYILVYRHFIL